MGYPTTAQTVNDAATELGLISADVTDPFASSDPNLLQMCRILTSLGRELALTHDWSQLVTSYTFNTSNGTQTYAMPSDFNRMLDQSGWNRTTRLPLGGPLSGQAWEYLQALPNSATLTVLFRQQQGLMYLYPTPSATQTIAYEYMSTNWVQPTGQAAPTTDRTSAATDILWFDPLLLVYGLKLAFLRAKGFDSTAAEQNYSARLEQAKAQDPAPVLSLSNKSPFTPLLDNRNVPFTGFGS